MRVVNFMAKLIFDYRIVILILRFPQEIPVKMKIYRSYSLKFALKCFFRPVDAITDSICYLFMLRFMQYNSYMI